MINEFKLKFVFFADDNFSKICGRSRANDSPYQHFGVEKGVLVSCSKVLRVC